ncbi:MAG: hypothetical protein NTU81_03055 [Candidatus Nomurabacteria bacterium]|nr:hypothetical protein [Candidatus Nomurabacteria bacterium]
MIFKKNTTKYVFIGLAILICGVVVYKLLPMVYSNDLEYDINESVYKNINAESDPLSENATTDPKVDGTVAQAADAIIPVTHIKTPEHVKALYISGWVAGTTDFLKSVVKIIDETEINAVVIDIKDSTGRISFELNDPEIQKIGSSQKRIRNIRALTNMLHSKNIYIIGRIATFQDPYLTNLKPEWAIKKISNGGIWKDRKGLSFLDPTNKEVHKYIVSIGLDSYKEGFDELNFDYIRYPSDGDLKDINYNLAKGETRSDNMEKFFKYLSGEIKKDENIPMSADIFGLTTEASDDMGIGQVWEKVIPYFDFVSPMVYPSHYPPGHAGYKKPALYPYEIINKALIGAVKKTKAVNQDILKIRPWLQDFDMGAVYTKEMVRAQMNAVYDNGLTSWMLWDPSNKYTPSALKLEAAN